MSHVTLTENHIDKITEIYCNLINEDPNKVLMNRYAFNTSEEYSILNKTVKKKEIKKFIAMLASIMEVLSESPSIRITK